MKKPLDCGFCKGKPNITSHTYSVGPVIWQVRCPCGMAGAVQYTEDDAVLSWNRIYVKTDDAILEALRDRQNDFRTDKGT